MNRSFNPHPFHLVDISPWPFLMAFSILTGAFSLVSWMSHAPMVNINPFLMFFTMLLIVILWWRDVIRESKAGFHTAIVQRGLTIGFILFILSEVMIFASFIWAYLHSALAPNVELGTVWPPVGIEAISPWHMALVGTCLLLSSGFTVTLSHHALILGNKYLALNSLIITIILGLCFTALQATEYVWASYTIADSIYGTTFFILTGLHSMHVIAGVLFLTVSAYRIHSDSFTSEHHLGYLFSLTMWHMVDVVWIVVYLLLYIWPSDSDTIISLLFITGMGSRASIRSNTGITSPNSIAISVVKIGGVYTLVVFDCIGNRVIESLPIPGNVKHVNPLFLLPVIDRHVVENCTLYTSGSLINSKAIKAILANIRGLTVSSVFPGSFTAMLARVSITGVLPIQDGK